MAKAGRKPASSSEETRGVTLQVRLKPEEAERVRKIADAENRSVSNLLRSLVLTHCGRRAK